jgi:hypothetical protein
VFPVKKNQSNETDVYVRLPHHFNWDKYLCIKDQRTIRNDNTIAYNKKLYQLEDNDSKTVHIEERIDGSFRIISKGRALKHKEITKRPKQMVFAKKDMRAYNRPLKPLKDHPWKQRWKTWETTPTVL